MSFTISENESYKGFDKSKLFHSTIPLCVSESSSEKKNWIGIWFIMRLHSNKQIFLWHINAQVFREHEKSVPK